MQMPLRDINFTASEGFRPLAGDKRSAISGTHRNEFVTRKGLKQFRLLSSLQDDSCFVEFPVVFAPLDHVRFAQTTG